MAQAAAGNSRGHLLHKDVNDRVEVGLWRCRDLGSHLIGESRGFANLDQAIAFVDRQEQCADLALVLTGAARLESCDHDGDVVGFFEFVPAHAIGGVEILDDQALAAAVDDTIENLLNVVPF